eukprot:9283486-Karenia_brevis.AAC.1
MLSLPNLEKVEEGPKEEGHMDGKEITGIYTSPGGLCPKLVGEAGLHTSARGPSPKSVGDGFDESEMLA